MMGALFFAKKDICRECRSDSSTTTHALLSREHLAQERLITTHKICASCSETPLADRVLCDSVDCPVLYSRIQAERDLEDLADVRITLRRLDIEASDKTREEMDGGPFGHAQDW